MRKYIGSAVALTALVLLGLSALGGSNMVTPAHAAAAKYYPPLPEDWQVFGPDDSGWYGVIDYYGGGLNSYYPQLGKSDIIPAVTDTMKLPAGMTLIKYRFIQAGWPGNCRLRKVPLSNRTVKNAGTDHPSWTAKCVNEGYHPHWVIKVQGQPGQCFTVRAQAQYYRKVVRDGHVHHVLTPIPHARPQTAQGCVPGSTTTTTTTTASP